MLTKDLSTSKRVQPSFIEPMQAALVRGLPDGRLWAYEAKFDGYRCLVANRNGRIALWSRRGNTFTERFPEIARVCEKLPPDTLIDGEVVAIDESGKVFIQRITAQPPKIAYPVYAFDILVHRGRNVLGRPLESRRELLLEAMAKIEYPVLPSQAFDAKPADLIRAAKELELEGMLFEGL